LTNPAIIGRIVELRITDTPGLPALGARLLGHVDSLESANPPLSWSIALTLDEPWPGAGASATITPHDPSARPPRDGFFGGVTVLVTSAGAASGALADAKLVGMGAR
jgi:hypothetical protein